MKKVNMNNSIFFVIGLCVVNVGLYASEGQVEGQPGAMPPGGLAISRSYAQPCYAAASSSNAPAVMRYYDKSTQTEISGQDNEQIKARLSSLINNVDDCMLVVLEKKISFLNDKVNSGSMLHARGMQALHAMLEDQINDTTLKKNSEIHTVLAGQQLLEDHPRYPDHSRLNSHAHRILRTYFNKK